MRPAGWEAMYSSFGSACLPERFLDKRAEVRHAFQAIETEKEFGVLPERLRERSVIGQFFLTGCIEEVCAFHRCLDVGAYKGLAGNFRTPTDSKIDGRCVRRLIADKIGPATDGSQNTRNRGPVFFEGFLRRHPEVEYPEGYSIGLADVRARPDDFRSIHAAGNEFDVGVVRDRGIHTPRDERNRSFVRVRIDDRDVPG